MAARAAAAAARPTLRLLLSVLVTALLLARGVLATTTCTATVSGDLVVDVLGNNTRCVVVYNATYTYLAETSSTDPFTAPVTPSCAATPPSNYCCLTAPTRRP